MREKMEQTPNPEADLLLVLQAAGLSKRDAAYMARRAAEHTTIFGDALLTLSAYAMKLSRELAAAREDSTRLDWWACHSLDHCVSMPAPEEVRSLDDDHIRTAIDAAMQEQADGE